MKSNCLKIIVSALILLFLSNCSTETKHRLNCICLIDYSGSLSQETLNSYVSIITETIFKNLNEYDRLIVIPIDEGAKTQAIKIVYEDLSLMNFSKSTDGFTHKHDSIEKRMHEYIDSKLIVLQNEIIKQKELRKKFTNSTDIFSALEQVQTLLEKPREDNFWGNVVHFVSGEPKLIPDNAIIIFSDMIHESKECNFATISENASVKFDEALQTLSQKNRIPNFTGCSIFVDGRTGKTNAQVENIKNFWFGYFKQSGGTLISYDYDCSKDIEIFLQKRKKL